MWTTRKNEYQNFKWILSIMEKNIFKRIHFFRIFAGFQADLEIDKSDQGNWTSKIYKQNPVRFGKYKKLELNDILQSGYHESALWYDNVDWCVNEVKKM